MQLLNPAKNFEELKENIDLAKSASKEGLENELIDAFIPKGMKEEFLCQLKADVVVNGLDLISKAQDIYVLMEYCSNLSPTSFSKSYALPDLLFDAMDQYMLDKMNEYTSSKRL